MSSKLASLHAGLVARKGEAMPAISHPAFSYVDTPREARWSDGGAERRVPPQPVRERPAAEARRVDLYTPSRVEQPVTRPAPEAVASAGPRKAMHQADADAHEGPYRLTFRMTHDQRRRLRIAAAKKDQSLQRLLSEALDSHLDGLCACSLKECTCLAREDEQ